MLPPGIDDARRRVWVAFADHFLDTETRHELPLAALAAVEGGLSIAEARDSWRYEVTPVVGANLWSVAGEWAGWDEEWLVAQVTRQLRRLRRRPGFASYLGYRLTVHFCHAYWVAIERLMAALLAVEPSARVAVADDLVLLGRHYFGFVPADLGLDAPGRREQLRRLYEEVFLPALGPTVMRGAREAQRFASRVEDALVSPAPVPSSGSSTRASR